LDISKIISANSIYDGIYVKACNSYGNIYSLELFMKDPKGNNEVINNILIKNMTTFKHNFGKLTIPKFISKISFKIQLSRGLALYQVYQCVRM
jgi:hypothetical protein